MCGWLLVILLQSWYYFVERAKYEVLAVLTVVLLVATVVVATVRRAKVRTTAVLLATTTLYSLQYFEVELLRELLAVVVLCWDDGVVMWCVMAACRSWYRRHIDAHCTGNNGDRAIFTYYLKKEIVAGCLLNKKSVVAPVSRWRGENREPQSGRLNQWLVAVGDSS